MTESLKALLLGGTSEGAALNRRLSSMEGLHLVTSLAGVTKSPTRLAGEIVSGGFGGIKGLAAYVKANGIDLIIDATHPFAGNISHNAHAVAQAGNIPLMRFVRPAWKAGPGDQWIHVPGPAAAAQSLAGWSRPFLTIGRKDLDYFAALEGKEFVVRSIEKTGFKPARSNVDFVEGRGPFDEADEIALMKSRQLDVLVTKNSGGDATWGKIAAARKLQIPVVMIERPQELAKDQYQSVENLVAAIRQKVQAFRLGRNT